ncbi:hypothetical protein AgCh_030210 [Apium graveolens]
MTFLFGYTNIIVNGVIILVTILNVVVFKLLQLQEAQFEELNSRLLSLSSQGLCCAFSLDQIQHATSNFSVELVIGKGGFGKVYKGTFGTTLVAIKRLQSMSSQGSREFQTEIEMLSKLRHSHLVTLIGYCDDGDEMILVYELMRGGTLADHLHKRARKGDKSQPRLSWVQRLKICIGAARGLEYLHTGTGIQDRIVHRDVKTTNILLDENLVAKISDFGLSKISPANQTVTFVSTHIKGTPGYLDPYYYATHRLTRKSDVYSFGIVLLEVLCGRPAVNRSLDREQIFLAGCAEQCFREGLIGEIIDPRIKWEVCQDSLDVFVKVAIQCIHSGPKQRPTMAEVVACLESALALQEKSTEYYPAEIVPGDDSEKDVAYEQSSSKMTFWKRFFSYKYNNNETNHDGVFDRDRLIWYKDTDKFASGDFSVAVVQANMVLEDQCQIESGLFGTFVGVYDGHCGPEAARYVCDHLFRNFQAMSAEDNGVVTPDTIKRSFLATEKDFTARVEDMWPKQPKFATVGTCCLVGVKYQQTLFVANLGDSRVVLGKKFSKTGAVAAIQLMTEHNVGVLETRQDLQALHPNDPNIVVLKHQVWRVKGIIQVSRSIGDAYMKYEQYNREPLAKKFRLPEPMNMPILSATPSILSHPLHPNDSFLIFASDGLWEHLSNEKAVEIVQNNPHAGSAKMLVKAALQEAARKREMSYSRLRRIDKGIRRHFHDDISVIVWFLNHDQISREMGDSRLSVRSHLEH